MVSIYRFPFRGVVLYRRACSPPSASAPPEARLGSGAFLRCVHHRGACASSPRLSYAGVYPARRRDRHCSRQDTTVPRSPSPARPRPRGVRASPPPRRRFHPSDLDHRDLALVVGIVVGEVRQRPAGCSPRAARPRPACALPACAPIALTRASTPPAAVILAWLSALSLTNFARALSPAAARPRPRGVRASPPPRCRSPTP